jgi:hypothetical protein
MPGVTEAADAGARTGAAELLLASSGAARPDAPEAPRVRVVVRRLDGQRVDFSEPDSATAKRAVRRMLTDGAQKFAQGLRGRLQHPQVAHAQSEPPTLSITVRPIEKD